MLFFDYLSLFEFVKTKAYAALFVYNERVAHSAAASAATVR